MVSLQPKLNLKVSQKQILTPGLVQMVSVLALNKLELKDMINAEMVENPVLEELEDSVPLLDDAARREEDRLATPSEAGETEKTDSFEEIDFGSFFRDYLDPGYRSPDLEAIERPSFENFLSKPGTLTDHLMWQLGAMNVSEVIREAAELIIGNLNEDGYLTATDEELMAAAMDESLGVAPEAASTPIAPASNNEASPESVATSTDTGHNDGGPKVGEVDLPPGIPLVHPESQPVAEITAELPAAVEAAFAEERSKLSLVPPREKVQPLFDREALRQALQLVRQMDPVGVAARDLRECLLAQLRYHETVLERHKAQGKNGNGTEQVLKDAIAMVDSHLKEVQNKQFKEIAKALGRPVEAVQAALEYVKTLDPRPGLRYNTVQARLIEPDVAFIKQGDEYLVVLNDEDVPQLRLNPTYRRLLNKDGSEKDVRSYIKEKYKSAIQLIKNIEQRKQTILKVCYAIIGRQREFLDYGIDHLKPMMIKEVAEEIGVHPSTVSRAVANKYAHTPQGVFELRYFFSESVNGPEGGGTSLLILKRRVKKLIEEEDPTRPYTDEQITRILQSQGIQVTRRTVAKYREDMHIPSTHQRRVKN
ncbi:MAG TPA: RNA polymerase factor sigma-54 [Terriglobales bacterium]|nr:RNA polymerase factor sigma-54 [Terriglobales bacterium]